MVTENWPQAIKPGRPQCFLPTIDLMPRRLDSWAYQLVLRACLDRIGRHDFSSSSHPFHGAALGGFGEFTSAAAYDFEARELNN